LRDVLTTMDAQALAVLVAVCAPSVHPSTASALIQVESAANPHAIGVVGAVLERQPRGQAEALATSRALRSQGLNFSVGLAQNNARNIERLGMTLEQAFDLCQNLSAMSLILRECFDRATRASTQLSLRRALSCYYSGNFSTGFRDGYVGRVVAAATRAARAPARAPP
jgi:type IV secretion system protein VirB1